MTAFHRFEENLRHYHCVVYKLKSSETRSRVDYILLRTTWILEASQQNYKASVNSLPPNVGGLAILVIRKQGAGKCL